MGNGGTEKYLQTIAIICKQAGHEVDFYYTNAAPILRSAWQHPDNNEDRIKIVKSHGINLIPIFVESRLRNHWNGSDFFEKFDESKYDVLITAGNGESEYPYNELKNIPIIHTVHGEHPFNQDNIKKSVILCEWQASKWLGNGGDKSKLEIIPSIVWVPESHPRDFRKRHNIPSGAFVYGFHQRPDESIALTLSLEAFSRIQSDNDYFAILGGSKKHRDAASLNGIKNVIFENATADPEAIHSFLDGLNVYAHSRADGEVCSACLVEALSHGLPIISHPAQNIGHYDQIDGCGKIANSVEEYAKEMVNMQNIDYHDRLSNSAKSKYNTKYSYEVVKSQILNLIK